MQLKSCTAFLSLLLVPVPAVATPPTVIEPSSKWVVNYADDMCLLERRFGADPNSVQLAFEANSMGQGATLYMIRGGTSYPSEKTNVRVFADGAEVANVPAFTYAVTSKHLMLTNLTLDRIQLSKLGAASQIAISPNRNKFTSLNVPTFASALQALETCRADLVLGWGMSLTDQARLKSEAKSSFKGISGFSSDDYPDSALHDGKEGKARVRLRVEADGKVSECFVMRSSGSEAIDKQTCDVYRTRYHYRPAVDTDGKPMASFVVNAVAWRIPED